jgi:hypothetical protein
VGLGDPVGRGLSVDGKTRWKFQLRGPIPYHSLFLMAGDLESIDSPDAEKAPMFKIHRFKTTEPFSATKIADSYRSVLSDVGPLFEGLKTRSYDIALIPDFPPGAMENFGVITLTEDLFDDSGKPAEWAGLRNFVLLHESIHRLIGNCLYPPNLEQIFFVEGLTQFLAESIAHGKNKYTNPFERKPPEGYRLEVSPETVDRYFSRGAYRLGADLFQAIDSNWFGQPLLKQVRDRVQRAGCGEWDYRGINSRLMKNRFPDL